MLADAIRSETYRLVRNRTAMFWSALFVPVAFAGGGIVFHLITKARTAEIADQMAATGMIADMGRQPIALSAALIDSAGAAANGAALVFMLVAAATLYAGDYRWETWRLISARNSRINLILGKVATFKLLALAGMAAFMIAGLVFVTAQSVIYARPLGFGITGEEVGSVALLLLLSFVRIVQYAMIALLTAVVTRSLLAALFVPVVLGFGQALLGGPGLVLLGWEPQQWITQLLLPGLAFDTLKTAVMALEMPAPLPDGIVLKAIISLALWSLVPLAVAIVWFQRQDLSKE